MNITPNLTITKADIRANPSLWNQKFSLIFFVDKNKKPYWTKDYNFIPHFERYNQAVKWIRETEFPLYNCKVVWNANNEIEIITQNFFGPQRLQKEKAQELLNKIRKKVHTEINQVDKELRKNYSQQQLTDFRNYKQVLQETLKAKTQEELTNYPFANSLYGEELEELKSLSKLEVKGNEAYDLGRPDLAILWRKQLYFIRGFEYSNNYNLTITIKAEKCLLFLYYWNWMKGAGVGVIEQAPLVPDLDHRQHYDFCGELGIKRIYQQAFKSYQPEFQLFRVQVPQGSNRNIIFSKPKKTPDGKVDLTLPSDVYLSKFGEAEAKGLRGSWWNDTYLSTIVGLKSLGGLNPHAFRELGEELLNANAVLSIGPKEFDPAKFESPYWFDYYDKEEVLFTKSPNDEKWFKEHPHLQDHTTFQFYFFGEETMSANWRFLGIKEKDGKFILPYKLFINYVPGQLHYRWEFKYITVKCNINNQGNFEDWTNPARIMRGISFKLGGKVLASGASFGFGANWDDPGEKAGKEKKKKNSSSPPKQKPPQPSYDKTVDPAMSNSDSKTVDFHLSLGEFFNRLTTPIFFFRINYSQLFYNRLVWANNKNNLAVNNLPIQWKNLSSYAQGSKEKKKLGFWRWREAILESDNNNFFTNLMTKGYWLTDGKELSNPNFTEQKGHDFIEIGGNAWDITVAEEEVIEKREKVKEELMKADFSATDYSNKDYIGSPDSALWSQLNSQNWNVHTGSSPIPNNCLGCLCEKITGKIETEHGGDYYFNHIYHFTVGGELHLKTRGSGLQIRRIPDQGGRVLFECRGTTATLTLEYEKITRDIKFNEKKIPTQEIDDKELEQEFEEEEIIEEEVLNEDELEQESGEGGLGAGLEKEREFENEVEQEEEDEEEEENEREDETEQEDEQEDEQESEEEEESEEEGEDEEELEEL